MKYLFILCFFSLALIGRSQDINKTNSNGKKQGKWIENYESSSKKRYEGQFDNGTPYGQFIFWYENGRKRAIMNYSQNGIIARTTYFFDDGKKMGEGKYINKEKDSVWVYYDDGMISYRETYKKGMLHGERTIYYVKSNVNTMIEIPKERVYIREHYVNNQRHGTYEEFYLEGAKKVEGKYVDGNKEGSFTYYYSNGKFEKIEHYKYAVKHGAFLYFDESGKQLGKVFYDRGTLLESEKEINKFLEQAKKDK